MTPDVVDSRPQDRPRRAHLLTGLLETITLYGLLGWCYVAAIAVVHPNHLAGALTHWLPLRRDTFGALCFTASAVSFLLLSLRGDSDRRHPLSRGRWHR
jgi:hypothetical protein